MPVVLDLFCGGGGAGMGYKRAGFEVIGVDSNEDCGKYFAKVGTFYHDTWKAGLEKYGEQADFIHASPPCQGYSLLTSWSRADRVDSHPRLIEPVRAALEQSGKPWIIENVPGAPLLNPITLCAWTFNYEHYRHRLFEPGGGLKLTEPTHRKHEVLGRQTGHRTFGAFHSVAGNYDSTKLAKEVMGIDWMRGRALSESIPPYFTHFLGMQMRSHLRRGTGWEVSEADRMVAQPPLRGGHGEVAEAEIWNHSCGYCGTLPPAGKPQSAKAHPGGVQWQKWKLAALALPPLLDQDEQKAG